MSPTIDEVEAWIGKPLPSSYRRFLGDHDDDLIASDWVLLYGRSSFLERNELYGTKRHCPGFLTIGNDSGGRELLLSLTDGSLSIVDAGSMRPDDAEPLAEDLEAWIAGGSPLPLEKPPLYPATEPVHVFLERAPASLKTLLLIKQHLGLDTPTAELKAMRERAPCSVTTHLTYGQAIRRCASINAVDPCLGIRAAGDQSVRLPLQWTD